MLPAGAAEGDHEVLKAALAITVDTGIHERHHAGKKLVHAFLLIEIVDYRRVLSGQRLEAFFAAGVRQAAAIEYESSAVSAFILRQATVKRKTENTHDEVFRFVRQAQQFLRRQHALERAHQCRQGDGQLYLMQEPPQIFHSVRHALQEMRLAFVKTTKSVGAQGL